MKIILLIKVIIFIGFAFLFACNEAKEEKKIIKQSRLLIHIPNHPPHINPYQNTSSLGLQIIELLYTPFSKFNQETKNYDHLAFELIENNPLNFRIKARAPFTEKDLVFSLQCFLSPRIEGYEKRKMYVDLVDSILFNNNQIVIKFKQISIFNEKLTSQIWAFQHNSFFADSCNLALYKVIYPSQILLDNCYANAIHKLNQIGFQHDSISYDSPSAPYRLDKFENEQFIQVIKNKRFTNNLNHYYLNANIDTLTFTVIKDEQTAMTLFAQNQLHYSSFISGNSLKELEKEKDFDANYDVIKRSQYGFSFIGFNLKNTSSAIQFPELRTYFSQITPVEPLMKVFSGEDAQIMNGFLQEGQEGYMEINTKKDEIKLEDFGWKLNEKGIYEKKVGKKTYKAKFEILFPEGGLAKEMVSLMLFNFRDKGISLIPKGMKNAEMYAQLRKHDFEVFLGSWSSSGGIQNFRQMFSNFEGKPGNNNYFGIQSDEIDSLILQYEIQLDKFKRNEIATAIHNRVLSFQPASFLYSPKGKIVLSKKLEHPFVFQDVPGIYIGQLKFKD
jgi:ABC-type transport system substrate-binding protein